MRSNLIARSTFTLAVLCLASITTGEEIALSEAAFSSQIRPLLERYCFECHADEVTEADLDLSAFKTLADVRAKTQAWVKIRRMLETTQMPPKDAAQPTDEEFATLQNWVRDFLAREALASAGDPGEIILRRLSNAEYTWSIRDLTGLKDISPAEEFPVDGSGGEGFTNVSSGQGMSPALVQKYFEAAKSVTQHAVLLPDGIRFSPHTTRRDLTDEQLAKIRRFYERHTVTSNVFVDVGGAGRVANEGGAIPLSRYLGATLRERAALNNGDKSIDDVARERSLSPKYLAMLYQALSRGAEGPSSPLMNKLREKWNAAKPGDADQLVAEIEQAQQGLWKFNPIGHIGRHDGPTSWMQPIAPPLVARRELRVSLPDVAEGDSDIVIYLNLGDYGDGNKNDFVVFEQPRIEFPSQQNAEARKPILLGDIRRLTAETEGTIASQADRSAKYLAAVAELHSTKTTLEETADEFDLNASLLARWRNLLRLDDAPPKPRGHFTRKNTRVADNEALNGWGVPETPSMLTNRSDAAISIGTPVIPARGVVMHPSPDKEAVLCWQSPIAGRLKLQGRVADADNKCGNGAAWRLVHASPGGEQTLASGAIDNGRDQRFAVDDLQVEAGDLISLIVNSRDRSHVCDTTHIELTLHETAGAKRRWNLAEDVVDKILQSNPLPDSHGNKQVWHFGAHELKGDSASKRGPMLPADSTLARWRRAVLNSQPSDELASKVQATLTSVDESKLAPAEQALRRMVLMGIDPAMLGAHPASGEKLPTTDLCLQAPQVLTIRLPAALVKRGEFVATCRLHAENTAATAQVQVSANRPAVGAFTAGAPVMVGGGENVAERLREFQNLFPPAVCYSRIVPVDEVVTLTLFHREDDHLKRLLLSENEAAAIDRLWDELTYISREPMQLSVAFEQISEFATQDRPDLVKAFAPLGEKINARAASFKTRLKTTEPAHLAAVLRLADRAWRRPPTDDQKQQLRDLYQNLQREGLDHEEAIRLTLARVLTSPMFLYKLEEPAVGARPKPVSNLELASRLSYFLWSSLPDEQLRRHAELEKLTDDETLLAETVRMLGDPRTRRLAEEFACQWLHLKDFDANAEKNEKLYPEFAALRGEMYEETVRFFEDLFRSDGSILDLIDADHTFLNQRLAEHYGVTGVKGDEWRRVGDVQAQGRGGVLAMATVLASQSGASRTSPILRGNWVYETLLGERLPRPPANVPQLPEEVPQGLTARELNERHSADPACAKCHQRIDPYGFSLEQYDAIGRLRSDNVDTRTTLPDGKTIEGVDGLRDYLANDRRHDFVRQFCRKLLGYSLGREVQLSDEPLLTRMQNELKENDYRFSHAVKMIVASRQFRDIRGAASSPED